MLKSIFIGGFLGIAAAAAAITLGAALLHHPAAATHEPQMVFTFPHSAGRLELYPRPCVDQRIIGLYGDDVPTPFGAGRLLLRGHELTGCWYEADGRVFFTDSDGDLLIPVPSVRWFHREEKP